MGNINGSSNVTETVVCPYCGKPLVIRHSRNDMKLFAQCSNNSCLPIAYYDITSQEVENLFYKQYYKKSNNITT